MPRNEKWEISPKFDRSKALAESVCVDIVDDLIEVVFKKVEKENLENTVPQSPQQPSSPCLVGVWVPDPTLPDGWKTCLIRKGEQRNGEPTTTPEKRMFYSPCGKLFSSRLSLERYFEGQNQNIRGDGGRNQIKPNTNRISPKSETIRAIDLCQPKLEAPDSDDDASDAISLSDDDFEDDFYPTLTKRKYEEDGFTKCPKPKKRKLSYSQSEKYFNLTQVQENILEECYKEWPIPFPDLVEQLMKDTGLVAWVIDDWFVRKTDRCLRALFAQDDI